MPVHTSFLLLASLFGIGCAAAQATEFWFTAGSASSDATVGSLSPGNLDATICGAVGALVDLHVWAEPGMSPMETLQFFDVNIASSNSAVLDFESIEINRV